MNESIKNLLSLNNKALQFAHDVDGFDFEKPYFIAESADRFTVNTVKKAVAEAMNPAKCKIVLFVVPGVHCYKSGLYYAILSSGKFDGTRREGAKYWNYRTTTGEFDIDHCYGVGDFEELRKKQTENIFIIAQDKCYIKEPETKIFNVSRRYTLDDARKSTDGRGNDYIKSLVLTATDGSGARFTYEPYNTFYGNEKRSADIADHIDKSGYLLRPHRFALMERAETLRRTRKQAEADNADYTNEIAELQKRIDTTRILLSNAVLNCQDATATRGVSNKMNYFSYALSYFETFKEKINSKRYASIERINSDIEDIKDKLDHCAE